MRFLKKLGFTLFSLLVFCSISVTAFASTPNVWATSEVKGDNSSILLKMESRDGKKHNYGMYATYYDRRGRYLEQKRDVDEYNHKTKNKTVEWNDIRDWSKVKVMMFCDGEFVRDMVLKKDGMELDNGTYIMCFSGEENQIIARMNFKSGKKHEYKVKLKCYDENNNIIETDTDKGTTYGESEVNWIKLPNWKTAEIEFVMDGERGRLGLSR